MIFFNQKMNLTEPELKNLIEHLEQKDIVLFPTMPLLSCASKLLPNIGSQDVSEYLEGPYTGQTSIKTLKSLNIKYCLLGHSEKRQYLNETNEQISRKIELCNKYNITPIVIIGETEEEYFQNDTLKVLESQIANIFNNVHCQLKNIIIAYEPIWSIGTKLPEISFIEKVVKTIKKMFLDYYGVNIKVIYGGGINSENIESLNNISELEGLLIGSSSTHYEEINFICSHFTS